MTTWRSLIEPWRVARACARRSAASDAGEKSSATSTFENGIQRLLMKWVQVETPHITRPAFMTGRRSGSRQGDGVASAAPAALWTKSE